MRYKVLIADDDMELAEQAAIWLKKAGFSVTQAYSGQEALDKIQKRRPDLVVMDVMLGDADGSRICAHIREDSSTKHIPVILMSSARTAENDVVSGLIRGADDYLSKPLTPKLFTAKVEAVLRRSAAPKEMEEAISRFGVELNVDERKVKVGRKEIRLTRKEFDLLTVLMRKAGKVLSPQYLLETVWGYEPEDYNDPRTVHVHMSRLKKKLGKTFGSRIENVIGAGYRLI